MGAPTASLRLCIDVTCSFISARNRCWILRLSPPVTAISHPGQAFDTLATPQVLRRPLLPSSAQSSSINPKSSSARTSRSGGNTRSTQQVLTRWLHRLSPAAVRGARCLGPGHATCPEPNNGFILPPHAGWRGQDPLSVGAIISLVITLLVSPTQDFVDSPSWGGSSTSL